MGRRFQYALAVLIVLASVCLAVARGGHAATVATTDLTAAKTYDAASLVQSTTVETPSAQESSELAPGSIVEVTEPANLAGPQLIAARFQAQLEAQNQLLSNPSSPVAAVTYLQQGEKPDPSIVSTAVHTRDLTDLQSPAANQSLAQAAIAKQGLTVVSYQDDTRGALGSVPVIVVRYTGANSAAFEASDPDPATSLNLPAEGVFVSVVDANGNPIEAEGIERRGEVSITWHNPALGGCFTLSCAGSTTTASN